ncbi:retrotransposon protein, putative, ty1-copia subclass, partial [Tanacetum coccineum]
MTRRAKKSEYLASYSWDYDRSTGKYGRCECGNDCDGVSKCVSMTLSYLVEAGMTMTEAVMGTSATARISKGEGDMDAMFKLMMTNTQTPLPATIVVIPTSAPATNTVANHAERPEKFNDDNDLQDERQDQTEEEVEPRRSKRARNEKSFGPDFVSFMVENKPTSYREAFVDLPPGCKPLGYKWIFKKKMKADGTIEKYIARLVIQRFRQREGLDYFDTYSLVMQITSIRMIIAIAALRNLEIHQMDVKTTFLNGDLEEEIYMNQPEGFIAPGQEGKVCRLVKSLYGLKQAPKQWHQKFDHTMLESGFKINECDKCVYVKDTSAGY